MTAVPESPRPALVLEANRCPLGCACVDGRGTCLAMTDQRGRFVPCAPGVLWACPAAHDAWVLAGRPTLPGPRVPYTVPAPVPRPAEVPPVFREAPDSLEAWTLYVAEQGLPGAEDPEAEKQAALRGYAREIAGDWPGLLQRPNLVLLGDTGTGKTLLTRILGRLAMEAGVSVRFVQWLDLVTEVKATRNPLSGRSEESVLAGYADPDLLLLDDVKPGRGDELKNEDIAHEVIKRRHGEDLGERRRATWVTSNLSVRELAGVIGAPALDRLLDGGAVPWFCTWPSYRRKERT